MTACRGLEIVGHEAQELEAMYLSGLRSAVVQPLLYSSSGVSDTILSSYGGEAGGSGFLSILDLAIPPALRGGGASSGCCCGFSTTGSLGDKEGPRDAGSRDRLAVGTQRLSCLRRWLL